MIYILIVDDHPSVREGTKAILETDKEIKVECLNPPYTIEQIEKIDLKQFDVILMDLNLGEINGIELSKTIMNQNKECKIILYTGYDVEDYWEEAIRLGIYGIISKTEPSKRLLSYIKFVMEGEVIIPFDYLQELILHKKLETGKSKRKTELLNEREKVVLQEVEKGMTNQEIADYLHLSKRSIEYSLTSIYTKLNVRSRMEAVLIAKAEGFID
ncbi:response regulator transcription factor [Metabacillus fastidiosus]|uniref:response regulator transcription factor n=1 Tax=Metabacillus fastidiosus TaxID=1458 RepID=UPI002E1F3195|nr:response regulator transcription factor [Metabacillus fastidiosus]